MASTARQICCLHKGFVEEDNLVVKLSTATRSVIHACLWSAAALQSLQYASECTLAQCAQGDPADNWTLLHNHAAL